MGVATAITLPDRYRLLGHIASGGMAAVWSAEDRLLERRVAVKVLAAHLAAEPGAQERFAREARAAARVSDHPHVVTIYDVGEHDGRAFMVMEHMPGGTVADRLREGRVARHDAVRWLGEAASALDAAHREGVVHRDVKPANLLLDARGRLAVGDFGIARLAADTAMTQTGMVLGTAAYIAPEQALGKEATRASDRYALAVVAYELLTGIRPFRSGTAASQARQHVDEAPPRASEDAPDLPAALDDVLIGAMAKTPEDRPASAGELADAVRSALDGAQGGATAPTRAGPPAAAAGAGAAAAPPRRPDASPAGAPDRRAARRLASVIAVLVSVGLLAALTIVAFSGGDEEPATTPAQTAPEPEVAPEEPAPAPEPPAPAPEPPAQEPEPPAQEPALSDADPVALNQQGYELYQRGAYAEAVPLFERSVTAFEAQGRTGEVDYAYALYNLGSSLNRSGRPQEAIPILERRLEVAPDNQPEVVKGELADARATVSGASTRGGGDRDKGKGKDKDKDKD